MIGEVAVQATQQVIDVEERLGARIDKIDVRLDKVDVRLDKVEQRLDRVEVKLDKLDEKIDHVETSLKGEMREMRNDNATFHDEIVGYLKRAEQEQVFTSQHLHRLDEQVAELQRAR